ncbi:MAG: DUF6492 family protein [Ruminococcus flavefaciens]|nr:DUF6492 family protein [Ruminococcus flavefaciens]
MMKRLLDVVIPITEEDLKSTVAILPYWEKYLPMKRLIFIGNDKLQKALGSYPFDKKCFIDEDTIIEKQKVRDIIADITDGDDAALRRTGWYFQQFLKMGYARYCEDSYYLIWDADTAPLEKVDMFEGGHPLFDIKTEKHLPFFHTIASIFPDMDKVIEGSFVSEHMVVNRDIMSTLILDIENNPHLQGREWYERILRAIEVSELPQSGFSEFETYGTYCTVRYPGQYRFREWRSCREGNLYFEAGKLTQKEQKWLAKEFDAISFEKWQQKDSFAPFFRNSFLQMILSYSQIKKAADKIFMWKVAFSEKYGKNRK